MMQGTIFQVQQCRLERARVNFENINEEILKNENSKEIVSIADQAILSVQMDLTDFILNAESFQVTSKSSANQCLSMTLQARKMRQSLDKSRLEILKPQQNLIKAINKQAKEYEKKLEDIEALLSHKIEKWLENPEESETTCLSVPDGTMQKKQVWDYEISDIDLVPRHLCEIKICPKKMKKFLEQEYDGLNSVQGLWITQKNELNFRVKND
jgi:hypothetical protein